MMSSKLDVATIRDKKSNRGSKVISVQIPDSNSEHAEPLDFSSSVSHMQQLEATLPMPDHLELEKRFTRALELMDLNEPNKKILEEYDDERKWKLICNQEQVKAKEPPEFYINSLKMYLPESMATKNKDTLKNINKKSSTQTLKDLEISLRTNSIDWVRHFLSRKYVGLDVLVSYMNFALDNQRNELDGIVNGHETNSTRYSPKTHQRNSISSLFGGTNKHLDRIIRNFKTAEGDVHICVKCLKAIMNHTDGFELVFNHKQAINCIVLSLNHGSIRTKTLVLDLLAALCRFAGGHQKILSAFDNFKKVCDEDRRFEKLVQYFRNSLEEINFDFMTSCMRCINLIVHSSEDMNFRVYLQQEFKLLGLDAFLEKLSEMENESLAEQLSAYHNNSIDVKLLQTDAEKLSEMDDALEAVSYFNVGHGGHHTQPPSSYLVASTQPALKRIEELEKADRDKPGNSELGQSSSVMDDTSISTPDVDSNTSGFNSASTSCLASPTNSMESLHPSLISPPPPPPPGLGGVPPPPPPPPLLSNGLSPASSLPPKKVIKSKYRLPILNWVAMKPNQIKDTIYAEVDEEKLYKIIDFKDFEERFRLGAGSALDCADGMTTRKTVKKVEAFTLLESNRLRNVAITRKKMELSNNDLTKAIENFDLKKLTLEKVDILLRIVPTPQEVKTFKDYEGSGKPVDALSDDDKFMLSLLHIERLNQRLGIMGFIGNFPDIYHQLQPLISSVHSSSISVKKSKRIKKLIEIILAFGNYMNSGKRGAVYGFKLHCLDMLVDTKSNDKKISLLHFIVKTIQEKFPDVANFDKDLVHVDKAATVSFENIATDMKELEIGIEMTKREYTIQKDSKASSVLKDFLRSAEDKVTKLKAETKSAQEAYSVTVSYFGEQARTVPPNTFYSVFLRFIRAFKQAELDLKVMQEEKMALLRRQSLRESQKKSTIMGELKVKQLQKITEKKVIKQDEVSHGTFDGILEDLKTVPFVRADAYYRSGRR